MGIGMAVDLDKNKCTYSKLVPILSGRITTTLAPAKKSVFCFTESMAPGRAEYERVDFLCLIDSFPPRQLAKSSI